MAMSTLQLWNGEEAITSDQDFALENVGADYDRMLDLSSDSLTSSMKNDRGGVNQSFLRTTTTTTTHQSNNIINNNRNGTSISQHEAKFANMASKLKYRYDRLPSPPWPQLDHRTSFSILNGHLQGFDPTFAPYQFQQSNTIVTAYYEFESKHGVGNYEKWFSRILRTCEPMIIFVEPESKWFDFVKEQRGHAPTIVAPLSFDNLVMSSTFLPSFWDFMHGIDLEAKVHKGSGVYKIWNEKLIFMYAAIHLNPFETPGFLWMDAGYFREERDAPALNTPIVKVNITEAGIPEEKLLLLHVRNDKLSSPSRVNIAGNAFVGTVKSFMEFYPRYYQTFWDWISIKKFIGSDQFVMTETCRRYKDYCHPFFPGRYKMWFAMAYALSGKRPFDQVSPEYLFLEEPPSNLPPVPSGQYVSFCNGNIVTDVNPEKLQC